MSDTLLVGLMVGMAIGAVVATMCKPVQNVVKSGTDEVKKAIEQMK